MKKVFSVLLTVAMLLSCLAFINVQADTAANAGVKFTLGSDVTDEWRLRNPNAGISGLSDGDHSITYTVYNNGSDAINVNLHMQNGWNYYGTTANGQNGTYVEIGAYSSKELTYNFTVSEGNITGSSSSGAQTAASLRFDIKPIDTKISAGTEIVIKYNSATDAAGGLAAAGAEGITKSEVTELPVFTTATPTATSTATPTATSAPAVTPTATPTPTPQPNTAVQFELKDEISGKDEQYFKTGDNVVTNADVKDGVLEKVIYVSNTGEEDIMIAFSLQSTVTVNGGARWESPVTADKTLVEAGKRVEISYECDVNDDGTVTIMDNDVAIEKLFYRRNIYNADGGHDLPAGTKFEVGGSKALYNAFINGNGALKTNGATLSDVKVMSFDTQKDTGDTLPVVMVLTALISTAALIVTNKKKKEN